MRDGLRSISVECLYVLGTDRPLLGLEEKSASRLTNSGSVLH